MKIYRMNKVNVILGGAFFAVLPILGIVIVMWLVQWSDFKAIARQTEAVITDISSYTDSDGDLHHTVMVRYIVDGRSYEKEYGYHSSSMRPGDTVIVNYDPEDPYRTMISPKWAIIALTLFALAFGSVGGAFLFTELHRLIVVNRLARDGKYIILDGNCNCMEMPSSYSVNEVRYMQMDFLYYDPVSGKEFTFSSHPYHPQKCPYRYGQRVKVYVDLENDPKHYYVNMEEDE